MIRDSSSKIGLRSVAMLLAAYIWTGFAAISAFGITVPHDGVYYLAIPHQVRAWLWGISAVVAILTCASRRGSVAGLCVLVVMPAIACMSYGLSWLFYVVPGGNPGFENGWASAYFYLAALGIVALGALIPARRRVIYVSGETEQETLT